MTATWNWRTGNQIFVSANVNTVTSHQCLVGMGSPGVKGTADVCVIKNRRLVHQIRYAHDVNACTVTKSVTQIDKKFRSGTAFINLYKEHNSLQTITCFPILGTSFMISNAWHRLHSTFPELGAHCISVYPRSALIVCFPELSTDPMFSRA